MDNGSYEESYRGVGEGQTLYHEARFAIAMYVSYPTESLFDSGSLLCHHVFALSMNLTVSGIFPLPISLELRNGDRRNLSFRHHDP